MPLLLEISYYAKLIAGLMVSAARTDDPKKLARIDAQLADALTDIFTLLSHDVVSERLVREMVSRRARDGQRDGQPGTVR